jgi:hypothetical protein
MEGGAGSSVPARHLSLGGGMGKTRRTQSMRYLPALGAGSRWRGRGLWATAVSMLHGAGHSLRSSSRSAEPGRRIGTASSRSRRPELSRSRRRTSSERGLRRAAAHGNRRAISAGDLHLRRLRQAARSGRRLRPLERAPQVAQRVPQRELVCLQIPGDLRATVGSAWKPARRASSSHGQCASGKPWSTTRGDRSVGQLEANRVSRQTRAQPLDDADRGGSDGDAVAAKLLAGWVI